MSFDLLYELLTTVSNLIRRKRLASVELTGAALERITQLDGQYHSYEDALAVARAQASESHRRGDCPRPMAWSSPRRAPRRQGSLLHDLRSDSRRDYAFQDVHSIFQRHRCGAP